MIEHRWKIYPTDLWQCQHCWFSHPPSHRQTEWALASCYQACGHDHEPQQSWEYQIGTLAVHLDLGYLNMDIIIYSQVSLSFEVIFFVDTSSYTQSGITKLWGHCLVGTSTNTQSGITKFWGHCLVGTSSYSMSVITKLWCNCFCGHIIKHCQVSLSSEVTVLYVK